MPSPADALRKLGATLVVKGSVQRDGSDVHLTVNLIDAKTLRQVGSAELDDPSGDLSTLQNDAVSRLAGLLDVSAPATSQARTKGSSKPVAYEEYLTALAYMDRYDKQGNLDLAEAALKQSIKTDPDFALGYAQLGEVYRLKYKVDDDPHWLADAERNCRKAIALDTSLPAAYATLGQIHGDSGKHDLALGEFQQALKLDPGNTVALAGLGHAYERSGRIADAEAAFQKAVALKPGDWTSYNSLGRFEQNQGRYPEAIQQYQRALELTPNNAFVLLNLGAAYADGADPKQAPLAEQALRRSYEILPSFAALANLGALYFHEHRFEEAAATTRQALTMNDRRWDRMEQPRRQLPLAQSAAKGERSPHATF